MTLHFVTIGKHTKLYIPPRFLENPKHTKNYQTLVLIYRNLCEFYHSILSSLEKMKKLQKELTKTQECFKIKLEVFKESVDSCRKKYVYAIWKTEDSEHLHNEMSVDVSTLLKESDEIGTQWRQIKASCK